MKIVKRLRIINCFSDAVAIIGVLVISTYLLISNIDLSISFISLMNSKPVCLLFIVFQILCIYKLIKIIYDNIRNKKMLTKSFVFVEVKEMIIKALPKNKAVYIITGERVYNGITYRYSCEIEDAFHLITDLMTRIKENGNLPDMKVYVDESNYEKYYIDQYEYLERLFAVIY